MAYRSSALSTVQIGVETTPGTAVPANKLFTSMNWNMGMRGNVNRYRSAGVLFPSVAIVGKEWSEGTVEGGATYTELITLLSSCFSYGAPSGAGTAKTWTFEPPATSLPVDHKTYTVEVGDTTRAHRYSGVLVTGFGYNITRDEFTVSGTLLGRRIDDPVSKTLSPTAYANRPIHPIHVDIKMAATQAGLAAAEPLSGVFSLSYTLDGRWGSVWPIARANTSMGGHVALVPTSTMEIVMEANAEGLSRLSQLRSGDTHFIRVEATGPIISEPNTYSFRHDMAFQIEAPKDFTDQDGVYAVGWTLGATYATGWNKATQITIVNDLTTL